MKTFGILIGVFLFTLTVPAWAEEFSKGAEVELVQDTPLYFKESTVMRMGRRGERFTVIASDAKSRRVYVSARAATGQEIALNIAAEALEPVQAPQPGVLPPVNIPAVMAARFGANRKRALQENGGRPEADEAVLRGLRYLVKTQSPDGSWGKGRISYVAAMTGFGVLSFLGHGETPNSPEFGATVKTAVHWIVEQGRQTDGRLNMEPAFTQDGVYAHAIATFALAEYYSLTHDPEVVDLLTKAVGYIVGGQGPDGGWMYAYDKTESDTSVSGWQIQALRAAFLSGLNLAGVDAALDKAMLNLKRVQGPKGGFGYRRSEDKYSLTGVGVLCTYMWKQEKDKTVRDGIQFIMDETRKNFPVEYRNDKANLYAWYYDTQACFMVGGAAWNTWNRMFQDQLIKAQSPDGSWPILAKTGGGELQADPEGVGPFYRTNLCILMLEVYYRYNSIVNK